jgi:hypothetical protein
LLRRSPIVEQFRAIALESYRGRVQKSRTHSVRNGGTVRCHSLRGELDRIRLVDPPNIGRADPERFELVCDQTNDREQTNNDCAADQIKLREGLGGSNRQPLRNRNQV